MLKLRCSEVLGIGSGFKLRVVGVVGVWELRGGSLGVGSFGSWELGVVKCSW